MTESFVVQIANGDSVQNKTAVVLNRAGDSPNNPILRGIGMSIDLVTSPDVVSVQGQIGRESPANERGLALSEVDTNHFRVSGAAGQGVLGFNSDYSSSLRQFIRFGMTTAAQTFTTEREFWIRQTPTIKIGSCSVLPVSFYFVDSGSPGDDIITPPSQEVTIDFTYYVYVSWAGTGEYIEGTGQATGTVVPSGSSHTLTISNIPISGSGVIVGIPSTYDGTVTITGSGTYDQETGEFSGTWDLTDDGNVLLYSPEFPPGGTPGLVYSGGGEYESDSATVTPGTPEDPSVTLDDTDGCGFVQAGPDRIVEIGVCGTGLDSPANIPVQIMENWKDEFNQKHFGGAKYVSVFEDGLAEDFQGTYIQNEYQTLLEELSDIVVLNVTGDHEYKIVFRFRSELNDTYYTDYTIRFRFRFAPDIIEPDEAPADSDFPDMVYDDGSFEWSGGDMTEFHQITAYLDGDAIALPTTTGTTFPVAFNPQEILIYGGEILVWFVKLVDSNYIECAQVYTVSPGSPPTIERVLMPRRFYNSGVASQAAFTDVRLVEPSLAASLGGTPGPVYLEVVNNRRQHKAVVVWTDKGSLSLDVPLRNGRRYDVTSLFDVDALTGGVIQEKLSVMYINETSVHIGEVYPTLGRGLLRSRVPELESSSAYVMPEVSINYPYMAINWPAKMSDGSDYGLRGDAVFNPSTYTYWLIGDKAIQRLNSPGPGFSATTIDISDAVSANRPTVKLFYKVLALGGGSGPTEASVQEYFAEFPVGPLGETVPSDGFMDGPLKAILYQDKLILTEVPELMASLKVTGDLGSYTFQYAVEQGAYDISSVVSTTSPSVTLEYDILNTDGSVNTSYSSITLARFWGSSPTTTTQFSINGVVANGVRLLTPDYALPYVKTDRVREKIQFDFTQGYAEWVSFAVVNPLDATRITQNIRPAAHVEYDISRLFQSDDSKALAVGNYLVVTMLHVGGSSRTALYQIVDDEWVAPTYQDFPRGAL